MNEEIKVDRKVWVDFIRSVSVFFVIVIHTASPLSYQWGDIVQSDWLIGISYNSFARVSVPLFFMLSGYLLLNIQHESMLDFFRKRFQKIFTPFLFWSLFYLFIANSYKNYTIINGIKAVVYALLTTSTSYHLWFLVDLLSIYLFVPLIRIFLISAQKIHLWYIAGLWLLFGAVLDSFERIINAETVFDFGFFTSYIGYFFIGYLLGNFKFSKKTFILALLFYILSGLYTIFATQTLSTQKGDYVQYYLWYIRLNTVVMSISAFVVFKYIGERIKNINMHKFLAAFAQASFGIYLIHAFVLSILKRVDISALSADAIFSIPGIAVLVTLLSWGGVILIQQVPILRRVVAS